MKKKLLPLAMLAGFAGAVSTAQAVHVNSDGLGQVLIYPYYTTEGTNDTYITVVNTTNEAKAVKVRFLEAMNSREVLDFNLYLSPEDHWAAAVTYNSETGAARLIVHESETSCTVPRIPAEGVDFRNFMFQANANNDFDDFTDGGPTDLERTREGYVEIIEMGVLDDDEANAFGAAAAVTHGEAEGAPPADCDVVLAAWIQAAVDEPIQGTGNWLTPGQGGAADGSPENNMAPASGGLYGYGILINPMEGTNASYSAVALDNFWAEDDGEHTSPGSLLPSLGNAHNFADVISGNQVFAGVEFIQGIDAVSAVFMHDTLANDYVLDSSMQADTDWVVTFPTKRWYVDSDLGNIGEGDPADPPFRRVWDLANGLACEDIGLAYWDRDETTPGEDPTVGGVDFSPSPGTPDDEPEVFQLCTEVSVITFFNPDFEGDEADRIAYEGVLNASERVRHGFQPEFQNGWMRFDFTSGENDAGVDGNRELVGDDGANLVTFTGLPMTGFAVQRYTNAGLNGVAGEGAFYAGLITHKYTRNITESAFLE